MITDDDQPNARVVVEYHSSSAKDGKEAYKLVVTEGATGAEADRVMTLALRLRAQAVEALKAPAGFLETQLEQGIDYIRTGPRGQREGLRLQNTRYQALPVCTRCGKHHPENWLHPGDCASCRERPVMKKPGAVFCEECTEKLRTGIAAIEERLP